MLAQNSLKSLTSGQVGSKCGNIEYPRDNVIPFIINGCSVSFSSNVKGTDEPIKAVKEILMSAYRTRITNR